MRQLLARAGGQQRCSTAAACVGWRRACSLPDCSARLALTASHTRQSSLNNQAKERARHGDAQHGAQVHVAYQTSGCIAVWDHDARRFADFAARLPRALGAGAADPQLAGRLRAVAAALDSQAPGEARLFCTLTASWVPFIIKEQPHVSVLLEAEWCLLAFAAVPSFLSFMTQSP